MFAKLLVAFIVVPLVELYLLLQLADATTAGFTFLVVIATGILGSYLARREGVLAWFRFQGALAEGRVPGREIQDGIMIFVAAALLLTPGLLTDALGFTLLIPAGRELIRRLVLARYMRRFEVGVGATGHPGTSDELDPFPPLNRSSAGKTVDAEFVRRG